MAAAWDAPGAPGGGGGAGLHLGPRWSFPQAAFLEHPDVLAHKLWKCTGECLSGPLCSRGRPTWERPKETWCGTRRPQGLGTSPSDPKANQATGSLWSPTSAVQRRGPQPLTFQLCEGRVSKAWSECVSQRSVQFATPSKTLGSGNLVI